MFLPKNSSELVKKVRQRLEAREKALRGSPSMNAPTKVRSLNQHLPLPDTANLPPQTARSRSRFEKLCRMAAEVINKEPHFTAHATIFELSLPPLSSTLEFMSPPLATQLCVLLGKDMPIIWDTRNHLTSISTDVISPNFKEHFLLSFL
jgi:hypothetical protein